MSSHSSGILNRGILGREIGNNGILADPPDVGWSRNCPHCDTSQSLKAIGEDFNPQGRRVTVYICSHCEREVSFAKGHPPGAI